MDLSAISLTLRLAVCTTAILLLLATPLAAWVASGTGVARRIVQALVALPLMLPPTVLGFALLWGLGPLTAFGRLLTSVLGHPLAFSFGGLITGSVLYSLPFAVQPLVSGFQAVDPELREAAAVLGASPLAVFRRVIVPLTRRSFVMAAVLTFAHTVGEFGVVLMLGGDIPGVTRTLSIALYDQVQEMNYTAARTTAGMLLVVSFVALLCLYSRRERTGVHEESRSLFG